MLPIPPLCMSQSVSIFSPVKDMLPQVFKLTGLKHPHRLIAFPSHYFLFFLSIHARAEGDRATIKLQKGNLFRKGSNFYPWTSEASSFHGLLIQHVLNNYLIALNEHVMFSGLEVIPKENSLTEYKSSTHYRESTTHVFNSASVEGF